MEARQAGSDKGWSKGRSYVATSPRELQAGQVAWKKGRGRTLLRKVEQVSTRERSNSAGGAEANSQLCDLQSISVTPRAERRSVSSARDGRSPRSMLSEQESDQRVGSADGDFGANNRAGLSDWRSRTGKNSSFGSKRVVKKRSVTLANQKGRHLAQTGEMSAAFFSRPRSRICDRGNVVDSERSGFGRLRPRSIAVRLRSASNLPHFEKRTSACVRWRVRRREEGSLAGLISSPRGRDRTDAAC
mgnify:CR=1 FL=1